MAVDELGGLIVGDDPVRVEAIAAPLRSIVCASPALPASPLGRMARMRPSSISTAVSGCT
jgi:hypothetical protein